MSCIFPFSEAEGRRQRLLCWLGALGVISLMLGIMGYSIWLRLVEWPAWQTSGLRVNGEWLLATNDAYFELTAAAGRALEEGTWFTNMLALAHEATGLPLGSIAFWLPVVCVPLIMIPPMVLFLVWRQPLAALAAGVLGASNLGLLGRTRLGFYDSDIVNVFFPLLLASLLAYWLQTLGQGADRKHAASRDTWESLEPHWQRAATGFCLLALAGLVAWVWGQFYPSGKNLSLVIMGVAVPVAFWKERRHVPLALLMLGLMAACFSRPLWGLAGLVAMLLLMRNPTWRRLVDYVPQPLVVFGIVAGGGVLLWFAEPRLTHMLQAYGVIEPPFGTEAVATFSIHTPNAYALVSEVTRPDVNMIWLFHVPWREALYAVLALAAAGLAYRPALMPFVPLALLSLALPWLGARFCLYGPSLDVLAAMGVALLARGGQGWQVLTARPLLGRLREALLWALMLAGSFLLMQRTATVLASYTGPGTPVAPALVEQLVGLDKKLAPGSVVWCWWDYGFSVQYYARRHSIADSHHNGFDHIFIPGFAMISNDSAQSSRLMRFAANTMQAAGFAPDTPEHVRYRSSGMSVLRDLGHEKAQALLDGLNQNEVTATAEAPRQYLLVNWDGLGFVYHMAAVGKWNLRTGGSPKYYLLPMDNVGEVKASGNIVQFGQYPPQELDGLTIWEEDGTTHDIKLAAGNKLYAIWNKARKQAYLLHEDMYNSTYLRLLRWNSQTPPVPGFALAHDAGPLLRVFESVPVPATPTQSPTPSRP